MKKMINIFLENAKNSKVVFTVFAFLLFLIVSCNDSRFEQKSADQQETVNSGKLTVYCDDSYSTFLDTAFAMYKSKYKNVVLTVESANSRKCMAQLLSSNARVVILGRDYLKDEDSLMSAFKVKKHNKVLIANDALVFFTNKDFPSDTLNISQVRKIANSQAIDIPKLNSSYQLVVKNNNSSEFANLKQFLIDKIPNYNNFLFKNDYKEIVESVKKEKNTIGVAFLSQIIKDTSDFKMIKIGYQDSTNTRVFPRTVHQANVLRNLYPFKVPIYAYLKEDFYDLPYWFATFLGKETIVQNYFNKSGIVPGFAIIKLIDNN
jgi:phosphate transport system substrate-binding protein